MNRKSFFKVRHKVQAHVAAFQLEVVLDFVGAVVVRHLSFFCIGRQIRGQTLPLKKRATSAHLGHEYVFITTEILTHMH